MSLKDLTKDKHAEAENTPFMKAVFDKTLPPELWTDFTYQKRAWYEAIEIQAKKYGLLETLPGIERAQLIMDDFKAMDDYSGGNWKITFTVMEYCQYIRSLDDPKRVMAHLYTWHMGDLFGGQMIKKIVDAPHTHLDFENSRELMTNMRALLTDDMADEANVAFGWAIKILNEYEL
jgi:heme oxygenase